jgi:hypothetical protein
MANIRVMRKPFAFALALMIETTLTLESSPASAHEESTDPPRVNVDRDMGREIRALGVELQALRLAISRVPRPAQRLSRASVSSQTARRSSQSAADLGRQPRCLEDAGGPVWWLEPMGLCKAFRAVTAAATTTAP